MLFTDDVVLVDKSQAGVNRKLDVQVLVHTKVHANISRSTSLTTSYYELDEV